MNSFTEILLFIAGAVGYNLRGRLGGWLVNLLIAAFKKLFVVSEQEVKLYHEHKTASASGKVRAR